MILLISQCLNLIPNLLSSSSKLLPPITYIVTGQEPLTVHLSRASIIACTTWLIGTFATAVTSRLTTVWFQLFISIINITSFVFILLSRNPGGLTLGSFLVHQKIHHFVICIIVFSFSIFGNIHIFIITNISSLLLEQQCLLLPSLDHPNGGGGSRDACVICTFHCSRFISSRFLSSSIVSSVLASNILWSPDSSWETECKHLELFVQLCFLLFSLSC